MDIPGKSYDGKVVKVPFSSSNTSTKVTCGGQKESSDRRWNCEKVPRGVVGGGIKVDRFGNLRILHLYLF